MRPADFWRLHPYEFFWIAEAQHEKAEIQKRDSNKLTEEEAEEMRDELRHARVAAGYPPE